MSIHNLRTYIRDSAASAYRGVSSVLRKNKAQLIFLYSRYIQSGVEKPSRAMFPTSGKQMAILGFADLVGSEGPAHVPNVVS